MEFNFNLNKGDSFRLDKGEDLDRIRVELRWQGDADLDAEVFLLGPDGCITRPEDFVFYNSENREEPFSREKFGNKRRWLAETAPMSADGSVKGSIDQREGGIETISIILSKVDPKLEELVICATIHNDNLTFKDVQNPVISVVDEESGKTLCSYALNEEFSTETAMVAATFRINEDGEWEFHADAQGYNGGLQTLVDLYA